MASDSESRTSEAVIKICENLTALQNKLKKEMQKAVPNQDTIKKLEFQVSQCQKGLQKRI